MKYFCLLLGLIIISFLPVAASAEETPLYESLSDVSIGRVFFSASQRARLDKLRGNRGTISASSAATRRASSKPVNDDAAGFIISSSGKARIYRNGDFVETSTAPDVRFPDDVTVTRKSSADTDTHDDEAN